jgi:hypothetical protein
MPHVEKNKNRDQVPENKRVNQGRSAAGRASKGLRGKVVFLKVLRVMRWSRALPSILNRAYIFRIANRRGVSAKTAEFISPSESIVCREFRVWRGLTRERGFGGGGTGMYFATRACAGVFVDAAAPDSL